MIMKQKNITKYDLKIYITGVVIILFMLCLLSYFIAPTTDVITLSSFNPIAIIDGMAFALSFGGGVSVVLSYLIILVVLGGLWFCLTRLIRKISKKI